MADTIPNGLWLELAMHRYSMRSAAKAINMPIGTFSSRMNKKTEWKMSEIIKLSTLLKISCEQFIEYAG